MTDNEKNTELTTSETIETVIEESTPVTDAAEASSEAAIGESTMAAEIDGTSSEAASDVSELPAEPPWEREPASEEDDLNAWIDADLARSGLTRNDIEIEPFKPEGTLVKRSNGGYKIIYRNAQGERFLGHNGKIFMRKRYRPPLPLSRDKVEMKYATDPGAGNHCYFPVSADAMDQLYDSELPLILVEGEKKARKATISGVPMIGLAGIWNWLAPKSERRTVTDHYKINDDLVPFNPFLIPIVLISWQGNPAHKTLVPLGIFFNSQISFTIFVFGKFCLNTCCAIGSISHNNVESTPILRKARSKPPIPAKRLTIFLGFTILFAFIVKIFYS